MRVTAENLPYNEPLALSGLRVFGLGKGAEPEAVEAFDASRSDPMTAKLNWKAAVRATGYNIHCGIAPDKLYSSHMVYGQTGAAHDAQRRTELLHLNRQTLSPRDNTHSQFAFCAFIPRISGIPDSLQLFCSHFVATG